MKRIMVLAGGNDQAALIRELRIKYPNCFVVLIDMAKDVVASKVADKHLVISTMDFDAVKQAAIDEKIDIILTACGDQPLLTMAVVSEELGLPCYLSKAQVLNLTNKKYMKKLMVDNGIPTSKYKSFQSVEEIDESGLEYPLVVKPADSNGSKGVRKVLNHEELIEQAKTSIKFSISNTIIVEEFNEGEDVSSDFYVYGGKVIPVMDCLSNKYKPTDEIAVIYQSVIPPAVSDKVKAELQQIAEKIADVYEISNSPLLVQTIVKGDKVRVVEFSARLGGGAKYKTIQNVTGFNVLRANLNSMLGETPVINVTQSNKACSRCHLYTKGGTFMGILGLEELLNEGIIEDYILTRPAVTKVSAPTSSGDRVASVFIAANDMEDLRTRVKTVMNRISILDQNGNDILLREMYAEPVKNAYGF
ncbi:MAG: ATP-grasp domain-containing protein [Acetatifactor sp.]